MIDKNEATAIASHYISISMLQSDEEWILNEPATIEKSYGWVFFCGSRHHLESYESDENPVGAPFLVKRENGEVLWFGGYDVEWILKGYELGFQCHIGDLTVTHVRDIEQTARYLNQLRLYNIIPELAYGVEWRIPQYYDLQQIKTLLRTVPVTFSNARILTEYETLYQMRASNCCRYEIREIRQDQLPIKSSQ